MTAVEQKHIDRFHEKVIALIYKRRKLMRYNNDQTEWDRIQTEIEKIEEERRAYERDCRQQKKEKSEQPRRVQESQTGTEPEATEAEV